MSLYECTVLQVFYVQFCVNSFFFVRGMNLPVEFSLQNGTAKYSSTLMPLAGTTKLRQL